MRKVDRELRARLSCPPPDLEEAYLRPYNSARQLLANLVPKRAKDQFRENRTKIPTQSLYEVVDLTTFHISCRAERMKLSNKYGHTDCPGFCICFSEKVYINKVR